MALPEVLLGVLGLAGLTMVALWLGGVGGPVPWPGLVGDLSQPARDGLVPPQDWLDGVIDRTLVEVARAVWNTITAPAGPGLPWR